MGPSTEPVDRTVDLFAGGVGIPSNLLISSGCLGLSVLNLTEGGGGGGDGGLVGLGGLVCKVVGGLAQGAGVRGVGEGSFWSKAINSAFLNRE